MQLAEQIRRKGTSIADPTIVARTGWTIDELHDAARRAGLRGPYNLVTLMVGVNDQFRGRDAEACRGPLRALLTDAVGFAGNQPKHVIVISIPDWGVTPFAAGRDSAAIAGEIDRFNRIQKEEADGAGVHYIDVTAISREARNDSRLVASDGLHPSGLMHVRWMQAVLPAATEIVAKP